MRNERKSKVDAAREFGIDLSLLYENLKLTATDRLRNWQDMLEFFESLRKAKRVDEQATTRTNP